MAVTTWSRAAASRIWLRARAGVLVLLLLGLAWLGISYGAWDTAGRPLDDSSYWAALGIGVAMIAASQWNKAYNRRHGICSACGGSGKVSIRHSEWSGCPGCGGSGSTRPRL